MCPYLEKSDSRCATHLNMRNIVQAYAHCAGCYQNCSVYRELQARHSRNDYPRNTASFAFLAAS